jgi:hypothetical protein
LEFQVCLDRINCHCSVYNTFLFFFFSKCSAPVEQFWSYSGRNEVELHLRRTERNYSIAGLFIFIGLLRSNLHVILHQNLTCQFLAGGLPATISQPFTECSVPPNITGPMYVFVTNSSQPLANNIRDAATGTIVAGPAMIFIDNQQDALAMAARPGLNSTATTDGSATTTGSFAAPTTITLSPPTPSPSTVMSSSQSWMAVTTTISPSQASAILASMPA